MNEEERKAELERMMGELRDGRARVRELDRIEREKERTLTQAEKDERNMLNTRNNNLVAAIGELQSRIL